MHIETYDFKFIKDDRGSLVAVEAEKDVPFEIKRIYYMFSIPEQEVRGKHAHKQLRQVIVCLNGKCQVLLNDGLSKNEITLDNPGKGLLLDKEVWHEICNFSHDAILFVLASDHYDEADYIRDYDEFISYMSKA